MPAAAVIPALRMHRTIAAVKKLVVGFGRGPWTSPPGVALGVPCFMLVRPVLVHSGAGGWRVYFEQIRVLKTGSTPECSCME